MQTTVAHCCFGSNCIRFVRLHEQLFSAGSFIRVDSCSCSFSCSSCLVCLIRFISVRNNSYRSLKISSRWNFEQCGSFFRICIVLSRILAIVVVVYPLIVTFSESWTKLKLNSNSKNYRIRRRRVIIIIIIRIIIYINDTKYYYCAVFVSVFWVQ